MHGLVEAIGCTGSAGGIDGLRHQPLTLLGALIAIHQAVPHGPLWIEIGPMLGGQRWACVGGQLGRGGLKV